MAARSASPAQGQQAAKTLLRIGMVLGIGVAGTLDEVILHQLLQWHNFYVHTSEFGRIASDGVFHLVTSSLLFGGALLVWSRRRLLSTIGSGRALAGGVLLGTGGFNLFDGTINHKVLGIHQVREGVTNILPYDIVFNLIALLLVVSGWLLWRRGRNPGVA